MSFAYASLFSTEGPPLVFAESISRARWTTPDRFAQFLSTLQLITFSDYDHRRAILPLISSLPIPQFFYTYSIDPLQYLILPKAQVRFPSPGTYIFLDTTNYQAAFNKITQALSYRDSDGPIDPYLTLYFNGVQDLQSLFSDHSGHFDRVTWELASVLVWLEYPPVIPVADGLQLPTAPVPN